MQIIDTYEVIRYPVIGTPGIDPARFIIPQVVAIFSDNERADQFLGEFHNVDTPDGKSPDYVFAIRRTQYDWDNIFIDGTSMANLTVLLHNNRRES